MGNFPLPRYRQACGISLLETVLRGLCVSSSPFAFLVVATLIPIKCQAKQEAADKAGQLLKVHKPFTLGQGSSASALLSENDLGWIILCCGGLSVQHRMFNGIPGLYPLDAGSTSSLVKTAKSVFRPGPLSPEGQNCSRLSITALG